MPFSAKDVNEISAMLKKWALTMKKIWAKTSFDYFGGLFGNVDQISYLFTLETVLVMKIRFRL